MKQHPLERLWSLARWILLYHALGDSRVLGLRSLSHGRLEEAPIGRSYILHEPCPSTEGIGSSLKFMKPVIEVAQRHGLTYVCQVDDFRSHGHHTGNLGPLFGCYNNSYVVGDMAAYDDVRKLPKVVTKIGHEFPPVLMNVTPWDTAQVALALQPSTLYYLRQPGFFYYTWGLSYKWYRSQYELVRRQDAARNKEICGETPKEAAKRKRIVLQIRRGDGNQRMKTGDFLQILTNIFAGSVPGASISEKMAHIVVISENNDKDCDDFDLFRKNFKLAKVTYFVGMPETDDDLAYTRLVRDLDCMSVADVLLLSRGGFASLAAALQKSSGVALTLDPDTERRPDVPNVQKVEVEDPNRKQKREARMQKEAEERNSREMKRLAKEYREKLDRYGKASMSQQVVVGGSYEGLPNAFLVNLVRS
uniref:Uncharacterized protein n=1 Tax=Alexandrium andersonii TaxID=327968 RepID=A0A7S2NDV9_9DINO|mmetsp:Transcript_92818/g.207861  ORF Transcript_92818/g.207861 Transcript_92818/m.207861 type:complete len:419 (+) Transcript_92818:49-1305(+)